MGFQFINDPEAQLTGVCDLFPDSEKLKMGVGKPIQIERLKIRSHDML